MSNSIMSAIVAQVPFGTIEIEGLMFENGEFGVALQQTATLFQLRPDNAQKTVKSKLGKDFSFVPAKTNREETEGKRVRSKENTLALKDFERLVRKFDREGVELAQEMVDALFGLSLHQIFCDAFKVKFEADDRQEFLRTRLQGKVERRNLTDAIQDRYLDHHPEVEKVPFYEFSNPSDALNRLLTGYPAKYWYEKFSCGKDELRDKWGVPQLRRIETVEAIAQTKIDGGMNPTEAIKLAIDFCEYDVWDENQLLGKGDRKTYKRNHERMRRARKQTELTAR